MFWSQASHEMILNTSQAEVLVAAVAQLLATLGCPSSDVEARAMALAQQSALTPLSLAKMAAKEVVESMEGKVPMEVGYKKREHTKKNSIWSVISMKTIEQQGRSMIFGFILTKKQLKKEWFKKNVLTMVFPYVSLFEPNDPTSIVRPCGQGPSLWQRRRWKAPVKQPARLRRLRRSWALRRGRPSVEISEVWRSHWEF